MGAYNLVTGSPAQPVVLVDTGGNAYTASGGSASGPTQYAAITPSDSTLLTGYQFLRIGVAGNISIKPTVGGTAVVIVVTTGEYFPFGTGVVMATNTTATGIVAIG